MTRISISQTSGAGYRKVVALNQYIDDAVDPVLKDLAFLRASIVNGCNYCVDAHAADLLADGVPQRKVSAVAAWRHSEFFTFRERLVLELADSITAIGDDGVSDDLYGRALAAFSEQELGDLILAIGLINLWNRIAIPTRMQPEEPLEVEHSDG